MEGSGGPWKAVGAAAGPSGMGAMAGPGFEASPILRLRRASSMRANTGRRRRRRRVVAVVLPPLIRRVRVPVVPSSPFADCKNKPVPVWVLGAPLWRLRHRNSKNPKPTKRSTTKALRKGFFVVGALLSLLPLSSPGAAAVGTEETRGGSKCA